MFNTGLYVYFNSGSGSGLTTADNGLTVNPAGNVQLGGALLGNTEIDLTAGKFIFTDGTNNVHEWEAGGPFRTFDPGGIAVLTFDEPTANEWNLTLGDTVNQSGRVNINAHGNAITFLQGNRGATTLFEFTHDGIVATYAFEGLFYSFSNLGIPQIAAIGGTYASPGNPYFAAGLDGTILYRFTSPVTVTDAIVLNATLLSAGNTIMRIDTQGTGIVQNVTLTNTHNIALNINGTVYYLAAAISR